jgi:hypothetical protein
VKRCHQPEVGQSSGAVGRLVPEDVTGLVRYLRERAAASSW